MVKAEKLGVYSPSYYLVMNDKTSKAKAKEKNKMEINTQTVRAGQLGSTVRYWKGEYFTRTYMVVEVERNVELTTLEWMMGHVCPLHINDEPRTHTPTGKWSKCRMIQIETGEEMLFFWDPRTDDDERGLLFPFMLDGLFDHEGYEQRKQQMMDQRAARALCS